MTTQTYMIALDGGVLRRGFWLYVWEVIAPTREGFLYVGRTGDSSSANAQSPFNRMDSISAFSRPAVCCAITSANATSDPSSAHSV
jgi:hypothetical protein